MGKVFSISFKQNFAPNTLGCYGLIMKLNVYLGQNTKGNAAFQMLLFTVENLHGKMVLLRQHN